MLVPSNLLCIVVLLQAASNLALPSSSLLYHRDSDNISTVPPSQDPFYQVPADVALYPRGHIFRSRRVSDPTTVFGPDAGDTHQLLFRTNGVHLNPDAAVTIVIAPRVPARGPPKIVAIASPEDSPAVDCATSWALYPHSHSKEAAGGNPFSVLTAMSALYNGWYVVLPDQEGSKAGWEAYSEGQVVLDSIRAIVNHKETIRDCEGYQAALTGYSGGGHGAAWAGQLASTYGKGIPIVALAVGGIPVDLGAALIYLDGTIGAGLVFGGLAGLANVYPKYERYLHSILKPNGSEALAALRNGSECLSQALYKLAYTSFQGSVTVEDPFDDPVSRQVLEESYLGENQKPITNFPVYQTHSQADEIVIYGPAFDYFHSQCSQGAKIVLSSPMTGDHTPTGLESIPSFFYFIKHAFEGTLSVPVCRQMVEFLIAPHGREAVDTVGQAVVSAVTPAS